MKWETVIGLEVHAELATKSKIFCSCSTAYGAEPNTQVCPICAGMPGTLPRMNRQVVDYALRLGLALKCEISRINRFDRKSYFYPDLPKAYQVSQFHMPICRGGQLEIETEGGKKIIRIRQIHMEEDAGKLIHGPNETYMDYNRGGVPLLEIVSEPDFRNAAEALAYLEKLREILMYLEISDCKMQEGSFRADVNISIRPPGAELGVRIEMKNLNSFRAIGRAIEYEEERQIAALEDGAKLVQETRRWDDERGLSYAMRNKENAQDYRYFPDPDLLPIHIDDAWLNSIKETLPELAEAKRLRYVQDYMISETQAQILTSHRNISKLFEELATRIRKGPFEKHVSSTLEAANLICGEIMRLMNNTNTLPEDLNLDPDKILSLIDLVMGGKINRNAYRETVEAIFLHDADPNTHIAEKGLSMVDDDAALTAAVKAVLEENQDSAEDYRQGKEKVFGFLMGQVMRKLGGKGNPEKVQEILKEQLT
ncbi:MAG: Asp-tRNA(Asn)/Glu-tRNA(Gln) amidotransferase subunit GatB [Treponema sp.]|nr:Asp-tRNA(Asn)/Glu-tRNA(Gln) amidotransferase subunit GatB [Treponema sp.]